jgi:putative Mn2+ efflux pump MntP
VLSILAGSSVMTIIDPFAANVISFGLLFCIGLSRIFDTQIKWLISKMHSKNILGIYADPYIVDSDKSNCISVIEAIVLSAALSLDGISVGFALGLKCFNIWLIGGCSIIVQVASVIGGVNLGGKLYRVIGNAPSKTMKYLDVNITAISGLVLILIGLFRFCM